MKKEGVITRAERREAREMAARNRCNINGRIPVIITRTPITVVYLKKNDPLFDSKISSLRESVRKPHIYNKPYNYTELCTY